METNDVVGNLIAYGERRGVARIVSNRLQSRTLANLRDTLLPKLLSGELSLGKD